MPHRSRATPQVTPTDGSRLRDPSASHVLQLASTICLAPMSLLLRQDAPGKPTRMLGHGLDPTRQRHLAKRCIAALGRRDAVWVEDAGEAQAADSPGFRHLAAVRLTGSDGRTHGILCVAAPEPRPEDRQRLEALRLLTHHCVAGLECSESKARADAARGAEARIENLLLGMLDAAMDAMIVVDRSGTITRFNAAAERMFDVAADRAMGHALLELIVPEAQRGLRRLELERWLHSERMPPTGQRFDMEALRADGSVFPVELSIARNKGGGGDALAICLRDASEQKRANARAEADLRAKTDFLSRLSHDIRTPLNGIIGLTDLTIEAEHDEDRDNYLRMMRDSAYGLLETVNSILDYSKIDSFGVEPVMRGFSPQAALTETLKTLSVRAREKGLDFRVIHRIHDLGRLIGDPGFLRQIAYNLVCNAIRFTDSGHVRVTVRTEARDDGRVAFTLVVEDSGPGIPEEEHERIFEAFTQAHDTSLSHRIGTGLGLAIARRLVEAMGGRIELESAPGKGSRFKVHLIFDQDDHAREESPAADTTTGEQAQLHVLVVDDNDTNRLVAGRLVARHGYRVTEAAAGPEAIEIAARDRPALVLMDLRLPGMNGLETMAAIRGLPGCAQVPAIALTAHALVGDRDHFLMMGMEGYVAKPFSGEALLAEMDRVLGLARVRRIRTPDRQAGWGRFSRLIDSLDGNPRLFAIIARKAAQEFRAAAEELPQRLEQRDWPALIEQVHRLKGSWPLYAAPGHAMLADRCMGTVSRRNAAGSREPIAAFSVALKDTAQELEQWLEQHRRAQ